MPGNRIHPTAVIEGDVQLGSGNIVMPYAVILGPCVIGDDNWLGTHSVVGSPPQFRDRPHPPWDDPMGSFAIQIGSGNRIREFVTVAQGTVRVTRMGNGCIAMARSNVAHDSEYEDDVTLSPACQTGGHVSVGRGANIGMGANLHQRIVVGAYAMIGMNATIIDHVPPFTIVHGSPGRVRGVNRVALERNALTDDETIARLDAHYKESPGELPRFLPGDLERFVREYAERVRDSGR